ncbi:MAG: NUDIX hydrolase [Oscillospiraceae bacterium]|nr:NUDIX hydrolase [Oscillospiraceae bacterium]
MYTIEAFDRPSVAADAVVFGIDTAPPESKYSLAQRTLKILLIRRGEEPFKGQYSLPGGFLRKGETIEQTAVRELREESGVQEPKLIPLKVYSAVDRDPRGWIISAAFLALTRTVLLSTDAQSDAAGAEWLNFSYESEGSSETITVGDTVTLHYENGTAQPSDLAFDHAQIIRDAFLRLRDEVLHHDLIFDLMPEKFAVSDLQQPYESILGTHTSPQNFRKKILPKLTETGEYDKTAAHRASMLYMRKREEDQNR